MTRVTLVLKTNEGGMWVVPQLLALREAGVEVTAIIPGGPGRLRRALDAQAIPVVESPFDFTFDPRASLVSQLARLRRVIRDTRPDVVFYHLYASALAARLATLGHRVRRVHMVAGPLYLESQRIRAVERVLMRLDSTIIAGSEFTARLYRDLGMPDKRVVTVPYGVDLDRFVPETGDRAALGLAEDDFVVVMVAYVYAPKSVVFPGIGIKGHDILLRAWPEVVAARPEARLVLVGGGFDAAGEAHRKRLVEEFGTDSDPTVRWLDGVSDVRRYYAMADVSVSPSLSENHGASLEASAMGVPSIVSDAGALPEAVGGDAGWVVRAGSVQALVAALMNAADERRAGVLHERGQRARSRMVDAFDLKRCSANVRDAVLGRSQPSSDGEVQSTKGASPVQPMRRPRVAAFSEQRTWLSGDEIFGRKSLGIVAALAQRADVELNVRVGPAEDGGVRLAEGVTSRPLVAGGTGVIGAWVEMVRNLGRVLIAVRRADIVYADQPGVVGGLGLVTGRIMGRPLVVNVVGDSAESVHPEVVPGVRGRVAHAVLPALQRWATGRALVANYVTQQVLQERYPARRARRTFAMSTATALGPERARIFPGGSASMITVGSLEQPYKGVAELIEATAETSRRGASVHLTVVGEGKLRPSLEALAREIAPGLVTFTGQLYGEELRQELGRHDVFVLASWTEGLPRALVEAMADGMACVATDVGGNHELLEAHRRVPRRDSGALADAIEQLLCDPAGWARSVEHNRAAAEILFSRRSSMDDLVDAIVAAAPAGAS